MSLIPLFRSRTARNSDGVQVKDEIELPPYEDSDPEATDEEEKKLLQITPEEEKMAKEEEDKLLQLSPSEAREEEENLRAINEVLDGDLLASEELPMNEQFMNVLAEMRK
jgi:hypothetical protein